MEDIDMEKEYEKAELTFDRLKDYVHELSLDKKELQQELNELKSIIEIGRQREYHSKFLKDYQKENGSNVIPDHDEIYKRYDDYKSRIDKAIEYIETCNDKKVLDSMFLDESYISNYGAKELLDILKGEDTE